MRPDLIRLLVDTRRKEPITSVDSNGGIASYSTMDRVGLTVPLDSSKPDVLPMKKMVPKSAAADGLKEKAVNGQPVVADGVSNGA